VIGNDKMILLFEDAQVFRMIDLDLDAKGTQQSSADIGSVFCQTNALFDRVFDTTFDNPATHKKTDQPEDYPEKPFKTHYAYYKGKACYQP
jgi:hypothetical protein